MSETPWRLSCRMPSWSKPASPRAAASCSSATVRASSSQNQGWMPDSAASAAERLARAHAPEQRVEPVPRRVCDTSPALRALPSSSRERSVLPERLAEVAPDAHRLADRLHLRRQRAVGARELLEREARRLDDDVVDRRLERGRRRARDVVRDLVERVADRRAASRPSRSGSPSPSTRAPSCARPAGSSRSRRARRSRG